MIGVPVWKYTGAAVKAPLGFARNAMMEMEPGDGTKNSANPPRGYSR